MKTGSASEIGDVVRVIMALAAQRRVWRVIGPAAVPLAVRPRLGLHIVMLTRRKLQLAAPALAPRGPGNGKKKKDTV